MYERRGIQIKPKSRLLIDDANIRNRRIGSIPFWDVVVNRDKTMTAKEYFAEKLDTDRQTTSESDDDPSIFEDADDDTERQFSGLSYYSALHVLSSSALLDNGTPSDVPNIQNNPNQKGVSSHITSNSSVITTRNDPGRNMTQLSDVKKQTGKAYAFELAGNPASTIPPLRTNDTPKQPMALVASSIRDVPSKYFDMRRQITAEASNEIKHEIKHDMVFPNILTSIEKGKVRLVSSESFMCDADLLRNCPPPILSSSETMSDALTFVEDHNSTDADILSGRGGKSNHHTGNKRFRHLVMEMKSMYRNTGQKTDKTALSRGIIAYVHNYGGRFLIQDRTGNDRQWRVMTTTEAQKKTSQALRETKVLKWTLDATNSLIESG